MKNMTTGLFEFLMLENRTSLFWQAIGGRLYDTEAPQDAEYPYAVYVIISDTGHDTFKDRLDRVYIQFTFYSSASISGEIKDIDTNLAEILKDKTFTVDGETVIEMQRVQANGPYREQADVSEGTGAHWRMDVDYEATIQYS